MAKAVLLLSGGLDSTLAGKLLIDQGIEIVALNFTSPFCRCSHGGNSCASARKAAEQLGIEVKLMALGEEYLEIIKNPRYGRGKGMNPCKDCRIMMFKAAKKYMETSGSDFVATGEVLGERPMSQNRRAMELIQKKSGLEDIIVRPLSAGLFPPSRPERENIVDRDLLLSIQGRRRLPQFELAQKTGITDYLCPGGGCLLTDPNFAARMRDLLDHNPAFGMKDVQLLKHGRHLRLPGRVKVVVGRNQVDNDILEKFTEPDYRQLSPVAVPGPIVLVEGKAGEPDLIAAAGLLAYYTKGGTTLDVLVRNLSENRIMKNVTPLAAAEVKSWLISAEKKTT